MKAAVLGSPIAHSLSPAIWRAAYADLGLTGWTYDAVECDVARFPALFAECKADAAWAGLSLTMPLKLTAYDLVDELVGAAEPVRAVNTVRFAGGHAYGHNTDVDGLLLAIDETGRTPTSALVLGAGGTARAAVYALHSRGCHVTVAARRTDQAAALTPDQVQPWDQAALALDRADLVINTTPAGAADALATTWRGKAALVEVLYTPWPTRLTQAATAAGAPVVGGVSVLVGQAVEAIALVTRQRPDPVVLRRAARTYGRRANSRHSGTRPKP